MPKHHRKHKSHKPGDDIPPEKEYTPRDQKTLHIDKRAAILPDAPVAGTTFTEVIQDSSDNDVTIEGSYIRLYITASDVQRIFGKLSKDNEIGAKIVANMIGSSGSTEAKLAEIAKYATGRKELAKFLKPNAAFVEGVYQPMVVKEYYVLPLGRKGMLDEGDSYEEGDTVATSKHLRKNLDDVLQDGTYERNPLAADAAGGVSNLLRVLFYGH